MRLIDADKLKENFTNADACGLNLELDRYAIKCIDNAPTIDPVRHGEWKETDDPMFRACSVCGYLEWGGLWNNYCPECGAKMDGGKGEKSEE